MKVLKLNAATGAPPVLLNMPIEVLMVSIKYVGPTSPFVSGGCPAPQVGESSPSKLTRGVGAATAGAIPGALVAPFCGAPTAGVWSGVSVLGFRGGASRSGRSTLSGETWGRLRTSPLKS